MAITQGAALQHAEMVQQEARVIAGAVKMPVPGRAFLITMGRAEGTIHVQRDVLQPVMIMKAVNPLAVQIGQRLPVIWDGHRLGLEQPHQRGRGGLSIGCASAHNLAHDGIKGEAVRIVDIFGP